MNATRRTGSIRAERLAAGLTQEQLAREAQCSTAYVRVLERGYMPGDPGASPALGRVLAALGLPTPTTTNAGPTNPASSKTGRQPRMAQANAPARRSPQRAALASYWCALYGAEPPESLVEVRYRRPAGMDRRNGHGVASGCELSTQERRVLVASDVESARFHLRGALHFAPDGRVDATARSAIDDALLCLADALTALATAQRLEDEEALA